MEKKKSKKKNLKAADKKAIVFALGEQMTVGFLYSQLINMFNDWWLEYYNKLKKENRIIMETDPVTENQQLKYIARVYKGEYDEFLKAYNDKIEELTGMIPEQYQYAFNLEKNFKYLNTFSFYVNISDAYTVTEKNIIPADLENKYIKMVEEYDYLSLPEIKEIEDEKEQEKAAEKEKEKSHRELMDSLLLLDKNEKYYTKEITGKKYQVNYYDELMGKSTHTGLGDAIFVPAGADYLQCKRNKKRSDIKVPVRFKAPHIIQLDLYLMTKRNGYK